MTVTGIENHSQYRFPRECETIGEKAFSARLTVDGQSPWFSGHFPGDPILPGIAQLDMIVALVSQARQENLCIKHLSRVKFRKIARPGETLEISASETKTKNEFFFKIVNKNQEVCTGTMLLTTKRR